MAKESKGQQVKTFKHHVPLPNLKYDEVIGKVYFQANGGVFVIYLPDHIAAVSAGLPAADSWYETKGARKHGSEISAPTIDAAMKSYELMLKAYRKLIENQQREKVIRVEFKHNIRWIREFHEKRPGSRHAGFGSQGEISFAGSPTINLQYEVLWRVDTGLYRLHNAGKDDEYLDYKCAVGKGDRIVPWTAEAESFFAKTVDNIERLIMAMIEFFDDMPANLQLAIENGGQLKIAPPAGEKP